VRMTIAWSSIAYAHETSSVNKRVLARLRPWLFFASTFKSSH
jgi:hypothetical protein